MCKNDILNNLLHLARQPFMFFTDETDDKTDNAFETLSLLSNEENVTAGRIAEYLDIKPSSVTQIIKKLEDAGTAKRVKSKTDARVTYVLITDKGIESLKDKGSISTNLKDELFREFTNEELETLNIYLKRMVSNASSDDFHNKLNEIFGDDNRWQRYGKMSSHFGRAREQMIDRFDNDFGFWGRRRK